MNDIDSAIQTFGKQNGVGTLEHVILSIEEYSRYHLQYQQKYPHIRFTNADIDGRILIQKDPN